MKNNIDSRTILNRKIIIEIRFDPIPQYLDIKGTILQELLALKLIDKPDWSVGESYVKIADNKNDNEARVIIQVQLNRISFISSKISSIEKVFTDFFKIYKVACDKLTELKVIRIGCRIQGTYKTKSTTFEELFNNFKESFPNQVFLDDFPTKDLRIQIVYQNGNYQLGPVKENDPFLETAFNHEERNNTVGIGLDTDNYLLNTGTNLNSQSKIKDVIIASLAVEKSMIESLKEF